MIDTWWGEPGLTPTERLYASNVFQVLALGAGTPGRPVNAVPQKAIANCQMRFVVGTDMQGIMPTLQKHLDAKGLSRVKVMTPPPENSGSDPASRTAPDNLWVQLVAGSLQQTCHIKPAIVPQMGGTICNDIFTGILGIPTVWIPHSYPACQQHAPDEHALIPICHSAAELMTGLFWDIGERK